MNDDSTYVDPDPQQFAIFKDLDRDQPIHMLNMLRFKERATYPTDHPRAGEALVALKPMSFTA